MAEPHETPLRLASVVQTPQDMAGEVAIPRSIPGLVTKGLLVMTFLEGTPITRMEVSTPMTCLLAACSLLRPMLLDEHAPLSLSILHPMSQDRCEG